MSVHTFPSYNSSYVECDVLIQLDKLHMDIWKILWEKTSDNIHL